MFVTTKVGFILCFPRHFGISVRVSRLLPRFPLSLLSDHLLFQEFFWQIYSRWLLDMFLFVSRRCNLGWGIPLRTVSCAIADGRVMGRGYRI